MLMRSRDSGKGRELSGVTSSARPGLFFFLLQDASRPQRNLIDLPGTHSLARPQSREEITAKSCSGRVAARARPNCCYAWRDATNMRLSLRLVIGLKRRGRPLVLVLNRFDIAPRRGVADRLSTACPPSSGIPV